MVLFFAAGLPRLRFADCTKNAPRELPSGTSSGHKNGGFEKPPRPYSALPFTKKLM